MLVLGCLRLGLYLTAEIEAEGCPSKLGVSSRVLATSLDSTSLSASKTLVTAAFGFSHRPGR